MKTKNLNSKQTLKLGKMKNKKLFFISIICGLFLMSLVLAIPYIDYITLNDGWNGFGITLNSSTFIPGDVNVSVVEGWNLLGYSTNTSIDVNDINFIPDSPNAIYENGYDLVEGWNAISIQLNETPASANINISLANSTTGSWNFLGYSSDDELLLTDLQFYDSSDTKKSYTQAITAGWIEEINSSQDGLSSLPNVGDGETIYYLKKGDAYWLKSISAVNISYEGVLSSDPTKTYNWADLRFSNGTDELGIVDAGGELWIDYDNFNYWGYDGDVGLWIWRRVDGLGNNGKTTFSPLEGYFVYSNEDNITLLVGNEKTEPINANKYDINSNWNALSIKLNETDITGDINISLTNSTSGTWNLLGYSSDNEILLTDIQFYDSSDDKKSYSQAISSGWIEAINGLEDGLSSLPNAGDGDTIYYLKRGDAFWLKSISAVNISYEGVGGSDPTKTYPWADIRFYNGTFDLGIEAAGTEGWIDTTLQYWNVQDNDFRYIWSSTHPVLHHKTNISSWQGIFVNSNFDNIEMWIGDEKTNILPYENAYDIDSEWNALSIQLNGSEITGDITLDLANSTTGTWNFLGYSSDTEILLNEVIFYDSESNQYTYEDAITNNWIGEINYSEDGLSSLPSAGDGNSSYFLKKGDAYWLKSYKATNISFPNVGGSDPTITYPWADIRFYNGSFELGIEAAGTEGWVQEALQYWEEGWKLLKTGEDRGVPYLNVTSPWKGYMVYGYQDDLTMLIGNDRQSVIPYWDAVESDYIEMIQVTNASGQVTGGDLIQSLQPNQAFWIKANEPGKLNFPDVGGWNQSVTFNWSDLRFYNGTDEISNGYYVNTITYGNTTNATSCSNASLIQFRTLDLTIDDTDIDEVAFNGGYLIGDGTCNSENLTTLNETISPLKVSNYPNPGRCHEYMPTIGYTPMFNISISKIPGFNLHVGSATTYSLYSVWNKSNEYAVCAKSDGYSIVYAVFEESEGLSINNSAIAETYDISTNISISHLIGWMPSRALLWSNVFKDVCTGYGNPFDSCDFEVLYPWVGYMIHSDYDNIQLLTSNQSEPEITIHCPMEKKILRLQRKYMSKCVDNNSGSSDYVSFLCRKLDRRIRRLEHKCDLWIKRHS